MQRRNTGDLPLITGPLDEVRYVGFCHWKRRFSRPERSHVYVVAHRGLGNEKNDQPSAWTHVYRIVDDSRPGRHVVYLEAVLNGDSIIRGLAKAHHLIATLGELPGFAQSPLPSAAIDNAA